MDKEYLKACIVVQAFFMRYLARQGWKILLR
ncbi:hypothetical protein DAT36_12865 [Photobacterium phosphoreum]|nr:hypothetical protein DAT36_12865 [Photobacterium phosphoreum]